MKISIVGTGNVANALGKAFKKAGVKISWIYGRNQTKAAVLAKKIETVSLHDLRTPGQHKPDIILIAVSDDAIAPVARLLQASKAMVVHTSGSVELSVLSRYHKSCGVFYPLQTFSKGSSLSFNKTPICLEANSEQGIQMLLQAASAVSSSFYMTDSEQRSKIHLAAVFANNFSNHMFAIAAEILKDQHLPFDLLKPIILTSAKNIRSHAPALLQTGPAKRRDTLTLGKHLKLLKTHPEWQKIYDLISKDIMHQ